MRERPDRKNPHNARVVRNPHPASRFAFFCRCVEVLESQPLPWWEDAKREARLIEKWRRKTVADLQSAGVLQGDAAPDVGSPLAAYVETVAKRWATTDNAINLLVDELSPRPRSLPALRPERAVIALVHSGRKQKMQPRSKRAGFADTAKFLNGGAPKISAALLKIHHVRHAYESFFEINEQAVKRGRSRAKTELPVWNRTFVEIASLQSDFSTAADEVEIDEHSFRLIDIMRALLFLEESSGSHDVLKHYRGSALVDAIDSVSSVGFIGCVRRRLVTPATRQVA